MSDANLSPTAIFVGRQAFLRRLQQRLDGPRDGIDTPALLSLYGAKGFGKTALCRHWAGQLKRCGVPHALLDLASSPGGTSLLLELRLKIGESSHLKFARFDRAYEIFHLLTTGVAWQPDTPSSLLNTLIEATKLALPMVPVDVLHSGAVAIKEQPVFQRAVERVLSKSDAERAFGQACRSNEACTIQSWLPWALAQDLEDAGRNLGNARPVLLFDTFERCTPETRAMLEELCFGCPSVLKLFSGQNPLDESWRRHGGVEVLPPLQGLEPDESRDYLARRGIEDEELQRRLIAIGDGYPLRLQLCADACEVICRREGRPAQASDFEAVSARQDVDQTLQQRLCRDLSGEVQDALRLAAVPRWFDRDLLGAFVPSASLWRIFPELERLAGLCAPARDSSGALTVRAETRQAFLSSVRADFCWADWLNALLTRCLFLSQKAMREERLEPALNYVVVGLQTGQEEEAASRPQDARFMAAMTELHQQAASLLNGIQRFEEALGHARRACVLAKACGDEAQWSEGVLMRACTESRHNHEFGDFELLDQAIAVRRDAAHGCKDETAHLALVEAQLSKAGVAFRLQRWDVARAALEEAEAHLAALPPHRFGPLSQRRLSAPITCAQMQGELEAQQHRWVEAEEHLRRAQELCETLPSGRSRLSRQCAARGWLGIAGLRLGRGDALENVEAALGIERDHLHSAEGIAKWLHLLGESYADQNFAGHDLRKALHALWLSDEMRQSLQHVEGSKTQRLLCQLEEATERQLWQAMRQQHEQGGLWKEWNNARNA